MLGNALLTILIESAISKDAIVQPELQLSRWRGRIFDGAHRVDVAIVEHDACFPIELKLGLNRMGRNEFTTRFLPECSTSHGDKRIRGSMISILERNWTIGADDPIEVRVDTREIHLSRPWALIVRKQIVEKWAGTSSPELSGWCKQVVFEDLVEFFGAPSDFNELVGELISGNHYNEWIAT